VNGIEMRDHVRPPGFSGLARNNETDAAHTQRAMMAPRWSRWKVKPPTSAAGITWFKLVPPVIRT